MKDQVTDELLDLSVEVMGRKAAAFAMLVLCCSSSCCCGVRGGGRLTLDPFSPGVPRHPLLAPWYRLVPAAGRLLLEHGRAVVVVRGSAVETLLPALLPLLDGTRTVDEIRAEIGCRPSLVDQALELLASSGLLVEGPPLADEQGAATSVAAAYALAPALVADRLTTACVGVVGSGSAAETVARMLRTAGVGVVERLPWEGGRADLVVVVPDRHEAPLLAGWNELALAEGVDWLPLRPFDGLVSLVGPLVVPGETACYECLLRRLAGHVDYGPELRRIESVAASARASGPLETAAAATAAQLCLCWLGGRDVALPGVLHVLETRPALTLSAHAVLRVPRCPACSTAERLAPPLPWHEAA